MKLKSSHVIANLALMVDHVATIQATSQNITASVPNGLLETNAKTNKQYVTPLIRAKTEGLVKAVQINLQSTLVNVVTGSLEKTVRFKGIHVIENPV